MKKTLSIVVPVYNEKGVILKTIQEITQIMDQTEIIYEVIVVDDGSNDGTKELLESQIKRGRKFSEKIHVIHHERNKGYGAGLKTGIQKAAFENICITDADATYPNEQIPSLYALYDKNYDMVVGQRQIKRLPLLRKPAKWLITALANFLVGEKIKDLNSGLRIFRKDIAVKFFPIMCDGFSFTSTLTLAVMTNNYRVKYHPIDYYKRAGKSKLRPIRDTLNFINLIIRTVLYFNPLKIFVPLSILLFIASIGAFVFGRLGILFDETPNDSITILFVAGLQVLAIGMIADLIDKRGGK